MNDLPGRRTNADLKTVVAIDGPAGAGKSTVAKAVAHELGFAYLDTGAMYRAVTLKALEAGIDLDDREETSQCAGLLRLDMFEDEGGLTVLSDGRDVTEAIRTPEVTRKIYKLDQNPGVRNHMMRLQREFASLRPTVAEGRDMGTVVFPEAQCKVYLDASLDERTRRRAAQLAAKQVRVVDIDELRREIYERDKRDRERLVAPLRRAEDAVLVDTTDASIAEIVEHIVGLARKVFF